MRIKLVVVGGDVKTAEVVIALPVVIGRGKEATLCLPHRLVSRTHCRLSDAGGRTLVEDLGSLNGTFVNNRRIADPTTLEFGQLLTIGDVTFRVLAEAGAAVAGGPAPVLGAPNEMDPTVHAGNGKAKPSAVSPDFTLSTEDEDDQIPAEMMVESETEEKEEPPSNQGLPEKKVSTGIPANLPKFAPRRRF